MGCIETVILNVDIFFPDVTHLEMMCFYGCLAVLANYLAFIMLYPACLALFLEVIPSSWLLPVLICKMISQRKLHHFIIQIYFCVIRQ